MIEAHVFKVGDVVRLRCGGPDMVIEEMSSKNLHCICVGFSEGVLFRETFSTLILVLVS